MVFWISCNLIKFKHTEVMNLDVAKRWLQHKCKRVIKYPHTLKTNLWQIALDVVKSLLQHKCQRTIKYPHIDIEN